LKFYEITIRPTSGFGTPLKGDTILGHFCWQASYDPSLLEGGLEKQIEQYCIRPFAIFSSAFPKLTKSSNQYWALKRPEMPLSMVFPPGRDRVETLREVKENKKKKWMIVQKESFIDFAEASFITDNQLCKEIDESSKGKYLEGLSDESGEFAVSFSQPHNTISRLTGTTGTGMFAPYSSENIHYFPGTKLALFTLIDEAVTDIERVVKGLERIGAWGFGRDASIGMGRFDVERAEELALSESKDANACYTLAPSLPDMGLLKRVYFTPFVRFGKHGERLAGGNNPFKNPVIMADDAAIFMPKDRSFFNKPFLGKAVTGVSKAMPKTVIQGYTPYLPLKLEQGI